MTDTTPVKVKADIMWADLKERNEMSGKFQVDLCNLSPQAVGALEDLGISVKHKDDRGHHVTCASQRPIYAFDSAGGLIEGDVGNGSKAIGVIKPYAWTFKNKEGVSASLMKLVITDLVTFTEGAAVDVDIDDDIL